MSELLRSYRMQDLPLFIESLCKQRDMFVVCDVLEQLYMLDSTTQFKNIRLLDLDSMLVLVKRLIEPKFMLKSKYKRHKICCFTVLNLIIEELKVRPKQQKAKNNSNASEIDQFLSSPNPSNEEE